MGAFTNTGQASSGKEMNPCRRALRDLMKEMLIAIPEILLVRDSPLLQAYNNSVDALAADGLWEKQMQDYLHMQQAYKSPSVSPRTTWPTRTMPNTTSGGTS